MYQPKIREDLIPRLYRLAKARGLPNDGQFFVTGYRANWHLVE
jgi:hypothetical protein